MKAVLLLATVLIFVSCDQLITIPKTPYGFTIGDPYGTLHIQAFFDLQCPDSKNSYNTLKNVMRNIDFAAKKIKFTFQMVPLPYHFYAFKLHQAFYYVQQNTSPDIAQKLIDYFFDRQDQFTEEVLMNYTIEQFLNELAALVSSITKVDQKKLRAQLNSSTSSDSGTRNHWKYSIGVYGVSGAPFFVANEILVDGAQDFGYTEWVAFLQKYAS